MPSFEPVIRLVLILIALPFFSAGQNLFPAPGKWREHLPYNNVIDVTASPAKIYAATPFSLFNIDLLSGETERMSKVSGLSETGISAIRFDPFSNKLFIAYTNSNIDVLDARGIHNIPEIKRENIAGDKTIYQIFPDQDRVYLSTGLGIIVLDPQRFEVSASWFIGPNGTYVKTNGFTRANGAFYAATEAGLKKISTTGSNPADFRNWQQLSGINGLSLSPAKAVVNLANRVIVLQNDSLFVENGSLFSLFFANGWTTRSIEVSNNRLLVAQVNSSGASQVLVLDANAAILQTLQAPAVISLPQKAIIADNDTWVADYYGGLSQWTGNQHQVHRLNGPQGIATGEMKVYNDILYATAGTVNEAWNYQYDPNGIYRFRDGSWTNFNRFTVSSLDSLLDFITIEIDPRDGTVWVGSYGGGLLHMNGDDFTIFKQNSPINPHPGDPGSYRVSGLAFDADNHLWISNFGANQQLHVLKNDGSWRSFTIPFSLFENAVSQILVDAANQKWIVSPKGNGVIVLKHNNIDDPNDDQWRMYRAGAGNGNLPSGEVWSIAQDKSGFIWVGTSDGIGVIQCPEEAFTGGCEAFLPVIREGNFNNYLFKGEKVNAIAVDGADRKWIGTRNGAWLISPDGDKVLAQFTEDNSPLPGNDVRSIAINGKTGEVFFGTDKGIASYRGNATEAAADKSNVLVFPNPVPPDHTGSIAIRGLPENSFVKITELNGRLVHQSRSLGGQAIWNGRDGNGNRVATGVYLVIVMNELKQEKAVTKIVFIDR
jgi:hypothetical protein